MATDQREQAQAALVNFAKSHPEFPGVSSLTPEGIDSYVNSLSPDLAEQFQKELPKLRLEINTRSSTQLPQEYQQNSPSSTDSFKNVGGAHGGEQAAAMGAEVGVGAFGSLFNRKKYMEDDDEYKNIKDAAWDTERKAYAENRRKDLQAEIEKSTAEKSKERKAALRQLKNSSDESIIQADVTAYEKAQNDPAKAEQLKQVKKFTREGQLSYLYGSLDSDDIPEADKHARETFEKRLANSRWPWRKNKLKRYQKNRDAYEQQQYRMGGDPELQRFMASLNDEQKARGGSLYQNWLNKQSASGRKKGLSWNDFLKENGNEYNALMNRVKNRTYNRFAKAHPQQALRYAGKDRLRGKKKTIAQGLRDAIEQERSGEIARLRPGFEGNFVSSPFRLRISQPIQQPQMLSPQAQQGQQRQRQSLPGRAQNLANRAMNTAKNIKNLANLVQKARAALLVLNPYVLLVIGFLILAIIVILIMTSLGDTSTPVLPALRCDTSYSGDVRLDLKRLGWTIDGDIYNDQLISQLHLDKNTIAQEQSLISQTLYNTICEVFQVKDFQTKMGTDGNKLYVFDYAYKSEPDCSVRESDPSATQYTPSAAKLTFFKLQNCENNQMQFLIAQQVARVVASAMSAQELSTFASTVSPDPRLTTTSCLKANIQTPDGQRVCFADTIATFIVNNQSLSSSSIGIKNFSGGLHGGWAVQTLAEAQDAYNDGINYLMPFQGSYSNGDLNASVRFATPGDTFEQFLESHNMKTILDMHDLYADCANEQDMDAQATERINQVIKSPVLIGYWIRDDYNFPCPEIPTIQKMNALIHRLDPTRPTIAGFGDSTNINRSYQDGIADILAFYPYPAFGTPPETEVANMLAAITNKTHKDAPPYIGLYQAFYGSHYNRKKQVIGTMQNPRSAQDVLTDVDYYLYKAPVGAISVGAFGWAQFDWQHFIGSDSTGRLDQIVCSVSKKIGTHCTM